MLSCCATGAEPEDVWKALYLQKYLAAMKPMCHHRRVRRRQSQLSLWRALTDTWSGREGSKEPDLE